MKDIKLKINKPVSLSVIFKSGCERPFFHKSEKETKRPIKPPSMTC